MSHRATFLALAIAAAFMAAPALAAKPAPDHPAVQRALAHLKGAAAAAGKVAVGDSFQVRDLVVDADGSEHVRFDRLHQGLRVIGGDFVVHTAPGGQYRDISISLAAPVAVDTRAALAEGVASARALAAFPHLNGQVDGSRLVIYAREGRPQVAWDVLVKGSRADGVPSKLHLIVDAQGRVIDRWDDIQTANDVGLGKTLYSGDVPIDDTFKNGKYSLKDGTRGKHQVIDMRNTQSQEFKFRANNNVWGNNAESDLETVAADVAHGQAMAWDYYKNIHGRLGFNDDNRGGRSRVHFGVGVDNAWWDLNGCQCTTYGDGSFFNPVVSADVVGHELSHGVTEKTAGLIYSGESGGLNEGTSDIFGTMVEFYANNASDTPDWDIGEKLYNTPGSALRYMIQPSKDGGSADCWYSGVGNLDVHYSSGVANHFFYLLAEGTTNGVPSKTCTAGNTRVATGNGTLTGIGRAKAEKIWYRALVTYMTAGETFAKARLDTIKAADDLYGAGSPESNAVAAAWTAVNRP
jgi:Zn-dependent metalloprotease